MNYATYELIQDELTPSMVKIGNRSTPVWRQNRWETGEFVQYIRGNGCGHCCVAMAARLNGVANINPQIEYERCRKIWGEPKDHQHHFISVSGMVKILADFGVPAACFGVPEDGANQVVEHIIAVLTEGKQVIFWSEPSEKYPFPENPFSKGAHYVLAAGLTEEGKIMIANSSERWTAEGVQIVEADTVRKALYLGSNPAEDTTWGEPARMPACGGYVVVG